MLLRFILIFLISTNLFSSETIDCEKDYCSVSPNVQLIRSSEYLDFSSFELISTDEDLEINTSSHSRNFKGLLNTYSDKGIDLTVNSTSTREDKDGSNFIFFADSISNLNITNNGFSGDTHPNSSIICANNIKEGKYGPTIKKTFEERRENNPELSLHKCDDTDLLNVRQSSQHTCSENYSVTDGNITANRHRLYKVCKGDASRKLCLSKKMKISCTWYGDKIYGDTGCCSTSSLPKVSPSSWTCDESICNEERSGWVKHFEKIKFEHELKDDLVSGEQFVCQKYFPRNNQIENYTEVIRDYGDFNGYSKIRDFSASLPNFNDRKYYKLEIAPGGGDIYNNFDNLPNGQFREYVVSSDWILLSNNSYIKCSLNNTTGKADCLYRNGDKPINELQSLSVIWFKVKAHYLNKDGNDSFQEIMIKVGHDGDLYIDWSGWDPWS